MEDVFILMLTEKNKKVIYFKKEDAKRVGKNCFYLDFIVWLNGYNIELGDNVGFNYGCYVNGCGGLLIGDDTIIGPYSMIHTANHVMDDVEKPISVQGWIPKPIIIGKRCWLGMGVSVLPGVTVGKNSIIGGASVVTKNIPPYSIAVGNPCRVIRSRKYSTFRLSLKKWFARADHS